MEDYATKTRRVRREVLTLIHQAQTSHIGSNLSIIDVATLLYDRIINLKKADDPERDRMVWSKGWAAATAYVLLKDKGILHEQQLSTYGQPGGLLGLVESSTPGIEASTGSMGHGLPIAVGFALAAKRSNSPSKTFVLMSDGEMDCGTTWESALLGKQHQLSNLVVIVDVNGWQAMGRTEDILGLENLKHKWQTFGWHVLEIDGHHEREIDHALFQASGNRWHVQNLPTIILAKTTKGKGVSFMEDKLEWHYKNIDDESYQLAMKELA